MGISCNTSPYKYEFDKYKDLLQVYKYSMQRLHNKESVKTSKRKCAEKNMWVEVEQNVNITQKEKQRSFISFVSLIVPYICVYVYICVYICMYSLLDLYDVWFFCMWIVLLWDYQLLNSMVWESTSPSNMKSVSSK